MSKKDKEQKGIGICPVCGKKIVKEHGKKYCGRICRKLATNKSCAEKLIDMDRLEMDAKIARINDMTYGELQALRTLGKTEL